MTKQEYGPHPFMEPGDFIEYHVSKWWVRNKGFFSFLAFPAAIVAAIILAFKAIFDILGILERDGREKK